MVLSVILGVIEINERTFILNVKRERVLFKYEERLYKRGGFFFEIKTLFVCIGML